MELGIGVDIERVGRFRSKGPKDDSKFFTRAEKEFCATKAHPEMHLAGMFAAKEAALKAVRGIYGGRLSVADFEVRHAEDGAPEVRYVGRSGALRGVRLEVSISHTVENAVAVAVALP